MTQYVTGKLLQVVAGGELARGCLPPRCRSRFRRLALGAGDEVAPRDDLKVGRELALVPAAMQSVVWALVALASRFVTSNGVCTHVIMARPALSGGTCWNIMALHLTCGVVVLCAPADAAQFVSNPYNCEGDNGDSCSAMSCCAGQYCDTAPMPDVWCGALHSNNGVPNTVVLSSA